MWKNLADDPGIGNVTQTSTKQALPAVDACDRPSTPYATALAEILSNIQPVSETEKVPLRDSLHRVAAEDIFTKADVPGSRNSAMDGYACQFADLQTNGRKSRLKLIGTSAAGAPYLGKLKSGECIRILTGGVVPEQLDTVIMQEDCELEDGCVVSFRNHKKGQHIRNAGEDIEAGEIAVARGRSIGMAEFGLLASIGCESLLVRATPKVAFFSTGDELRGVGESLGMGDVYDSNRYTLYALLQQTYVQPIDLGVVRDNLDDTIETLSAAAQQADVVITSAGASVGDSDFVRLALESLGELKLWRIAMKPGRPLAFGRINSCWFFGLPGNPVSVVVTFDKFVKPALRKLRGENPIKHLELSARCTTPIRKSPGRLEFQRGVLSYDRNGDMVVESTGNQSSGVLTSMTKANCYIVLPLECGNLPVGSTVTVQPFGIELECIR